uniref:CBM21 domain-containing protein n=1 Tax=Poecilia latipinna TaxID=48699 RepID=A0A3B3UJ52_9TELE
MSDFASLTSFQTSSQMSEIGVVSTVQLIFFSAHKKRVIFADEVGRALTVEHVFTTEPPNGSLTPKFRLGFSQPAKDSDALIARLQEKCVQMKSCSISDNTLIGEVCVFHSCPKSTVNMKMTFDSWITLKNIPCKFLEQRRVNGLDVDVFFFEACLPQITDKIERIEFCFTSSPGLSSVVHRDDNMGQNYKVLRETAGSSPSKDYTKQFYPIQLGYEDIPAAYLYAVSSIFASIHPYNELGYNLQKIL